MLNLSNTVRERCVRFGTYLLENQTTVRATAKVFQVSKSTVHKDVTHELKAVNPHLYEQVAELMERNRAVRHLRGGEATRMKYLHIKHEK